MPPEFSSVSPRSTREPISNFVTVNGVRLHCLDWGGDGAPIIVLHATGLLGRIYRPIADALTAVGHVYSYDQRGHGDSDRSPDGVYTWDRTADDLEAFILTMGFREVRAFGHSAGATAIGTVLSRRPDLITRAFLAEPVLIDPASPPTRNTMLYEATLKRRANFDSLPAMLANYAGKPPFNTWRSGILNEYCIHGSRDGADGRRYLKCIPADEALVYQSAPNFDGLGYILRSRNPLHILFGVRTDTQGITLADRITANAPQRRFTVVPNAGHFLPMEEPDYVADEAVGFLKAT
ncbi:MAG TPA: alpha/beta hydrolase [Candidatus Binataceae bacterium]|nr:alpha/beta hydrolase [Candidatus Binataceae bacterium]